MSVGAYDEKDTAGDSGPGVAGALGRFRPTGAGRPTPMARPDPAAGPGRGSGQGRPDPAGLERLYAQQPGPAEGLRPQPDDPWLQGERAGLRRAPLSRTRP